MGHGRNQPLLDYIARRLKELRTEKGLNLEDVYNDTGIHIARIETAKLNLTISTLSQLCKYYNITLDSFFKGYQS